MSTCRDNCAKGARHCTRAHGMHRVEKGAEAEAESPNTPLQHLPPPHSHAARPTGPPPSLHAHGPRRRMAGGRHVYTHATPDTRAATQLQAPHTHTQTAQARDGVSQHTAHVPNTRRVTLKQPAAHLGRTHHITRGHLYTKWRVGSPNILHHGTRTWPKKYSVSSLPSVEAGPHFTAATATLTWCWRAWC